MVWEEGWKIVMPSIKGNGRGIRAKTRLCVRCPRPCRWRRCVWDWQIGAGRRSVRQGERDRWQGGLMHPKVCDVHVREEKKRNVTVIPNSYSNSFTVAAFFVPAKLIARKEKRVSFLSHFEVLGYFVTCGKCRAAVTVDVQKTTCRNYLSCESDWRVEARLRDAYWVSQSVRDEWQAVKKKK